jgi:hypothetical protein
MVFRKRIDFTYSKKKEITRKDQSHKKQKLKRLNQIHL